jgi:hypothetical protein
MLRSFLFLAFSAQILSGCISYMSGQDGRTSGKGQFAGHGGVSYYQATQGDAEDATEKTENSQIGYFAAVRAGVTERVDLGFKASTTGMGGVTSKFQVIDSGKFALSVGLEGAYRQVSSKTRSSKTTSATTVSFNDNKYRNIVGELPIFMSMDLSPDYAAYLTPRYIHIDIQQTNFSGGGTDDSSTRVAALSVGMLKRGMPGGFLEIVYAKSPDKKLQDKGQFEIGMGMTVSTTQLVKPAAKTPKR